MGTRETGQNRVGTEGTGQDGVGIGQDGIGIGQDGIGIGQDGMASRK